MKNITSNHTLQKPLLTITISFVIMSIFLSASFEYGIAAQYLPEIDYEESYNLSIINTEEVSTGESDNQDDTILPELLVDQDHFLPPGFVNISENRIEAFSIQMPQLDDQERTIIVLLPDSYLNSSTAYPVIYLQNAQDIFHRAGPLADDWFVNQPMLDYFSQGLENSAIVVGITYNSIYYWDEYSPWVNDDMYRWMDPYDANRVEGGKGDAYLDFVISTLKPEIDNKFRTQPDRSNTSIAGYHMGGFFAIYAGLTRPDIFSRVLTLSPAIWFAEDGGPWLSNNRLLNLVKESGVPDNVAFFFDIADQEKNTTLEVRPVVYDFQGNKISFPQAYYESTFALMTMLESKGLSRDNILSGIGYVEVKPADFSEQTSEDYQYLYYFPIFAKNTPSQFHSINFSLQPYLNRTRKIWVYLPPNYNPDPSNGGYQVIYMLSSQHVFGEQTGAYVEPIRDWRFDETLDSLYAQTGKGTIAVGIEYDRKYPWDESMPWDNNNMDNWLRLEGKDAEVKGRGIAFLNFIVNDLKPYIDTNYNTKPEREHTAIGGGSRYGYFALYAGLTRPDIFSKVMSMSPAVWLAEGGPVLPLGQPVWLSTNQLSAWFDNHQAPKNVQYYIFIGTNEYSGPGSPYPHAYNASGRKLTMPEIYVSGADRVNNKLTGQGVTTLNYVKLVGGTHNPEIWGLYVEPSLKWFGFYE